MKKWLPTITTFIALVLFSLADISIRVYYNMQQENKKVYLLYIWPCTSFEKGWEIKNVQKKDNEITFDIADTDRKVSMSNSVPHIILEKIDGEEEQKSMNDEVHL